MVHIVLYKFNIILTNITIAKPGEGEKGIGKFKARLTFAIIYFPLKDALYVS